jgi:hypothetical protein
MPNDAAAEKAGSAEHGDGATVRCHHDSNRQLCRSFSLLVVKEPSGRSSNRSILLATPFLVRMHPEVRRNLPLDHDGPSGAKTHFVSFGTPHTHFQKK